LNQLVPLAKRLGAYDCTLVRSIDDWYELVKDGHPDFDGAVVDLHLTPTFDDYFGFEILKQLRQREIPAIIMTANPGDGEYAPAHRNLIMHDPHNIILKRLEAPADEPKLREAVHAMMDGRPGVDWHSLGSRES
jgi:CheY-like chemotaxis protein